MKFASSLSGNKLCSLEARRGGTDSKMGRGGDDGQCVRRGEEEEDGCMGRPHARTHENTNGRGAKKE